MAHRGGPATAAKLATNYSTQTSNPNFPFPGPPPPPLKTHDSLKQNPGPSMAVFFTTPSLPSLPQALPHSTHSLLDPLLEAFEGLLCARPRATTLAAAAPLERKAHDRLEKIDHAITHLCRNLVAGLDDHLPPGGLSLVITDVSLATLEI